MLLKDEITTFRFGGKYTKHQCIMLHNPINMRPGRSCTMLMRDYEKLSRNVYSDQTGKIISEYEKGATIGYGHLIKDVTEFNRFKNGITEAESYFLFESDLNNFICAVRKNVKVRLSQNEFDALIMLSFNIGISAFKSSTILKIINGEKIGDLKKAWSLYRYSQGKIMPGLVRRRETEINVFFNGVYFRK